MIDRHPPQRPKPRVAGARRTTHGRESRPSTDRRLAERWRTALTTGATILVIVAPAYAGARALALADYDFRIASLILSHTNVSQLAASGAVFAVPVVLAGVALLAPPVFKDRVASALLWYGVFIISVVLAVHVFSGGGGPWIAAEAFIVAVALFAAALVLDTRRLLRISGNLTAFQQARMDLAARYGVPQTLSPRDATKTRLLDGPGDVAAVIFWVVAVLSYCVFSLQAQPRTWISFADSTQAVAVSWISDSNGGTIYLLDAPELDRADRMRWHPGEPSAIVYCESTPIKRADGLLGCALKD